MDRPLTTAWRRNDSFILYLGLARRSRYSILDKGYRDYEFSRVGDYDCAIQPATGVGEFEPTGNHFAGNYEMTAGKKLEPAAISGIGPLVESRWSLYGVEAGINHCGPFSFPAKDQQMKEKKYIVVYSSMWCSAHVIVVAKTEKDAVWKSVVFFNELIIKSIQDMENLHSSFMSSNPINWCFPAVEEVKPGSFWDSKDNFSYRIRYDLLEYGMW